MPSGIMVFDNYNGGIFFDPNERWRFSCIVDGALFSSYSKLKVIVSGKVKSNGEAGNSTVNLRQGGTPYGIDGALIGSTVLPSGPFLFSFAATIARPTGREIFTVTTVGDGGAHNAFLEPVVVMAQGVE